MSVRHPLRWRLRRMDWRLRQADPHLAAMLAVFARLYAGEPIASERIGWQDEIAITRARRAFRSLGNAIVQPRAGWESSWLGLSSGRAVPRADRRYG